MWFPFRVLTGLYFACVHPVNVNYTVDHVPTSQSTLVDVSSQVTLVDVSSQVTVDQAGHIFDLYGSQPVFSSAGSYIRNASNQIVGFTYVAAP